MKAYFETYGCSMSYGESEQLMQIALDKGWDRTDSVEDADMVVVSTCVVIQATEARVGHRLKVLAKKGKTLVVFGCMVSSMAEKVRRLAPHSILLRPDEILEFDHIIEDIGPPKDLKDTSIHLNLPIANGCLGKCTYCITRLARKKLVSRPMDDLLKRVKREISRGRKEIRLTAQDSGVYGMDLPSGSDLPTLIRSICSLKDDFMVRVGMMNPNSLFRILIPFVKEFSNDKVFNFLHLPLQSGSDRVLAAMGRQYSVRDYLKALDTIRSKVKGLYLATDIIAGFPGESDEDFKDTVNLIERLRPDVMNIKAFSARPGTLAKKMPDRVDTRIVKKRTQRLSRLRDRITHENLEGFVGQRSCVLLTEVQREGTTMGRTQDYRPIVIGEELPLGQFVSVEITGSQHGYLIGEMIRTFN